MEFKNEVEVEATPEAIWEVLTSAEDLAECIPGAESVEKVSETEYKGTITQTVAGITVTLSGDVDVTELRPYEFMSASVTGSNSQASSWTKVRADAEMTITEGDPSTILDYELTADVSGKLASLGAKLIKPTVRANVEEFFDNVEDLAAQR